MGDTPDTGAGTPPEWPHRVDGDYLSVAVCEKCGEQWPCDSQRVLDAARTATDPAGLDAIRALKWLADETAAHIAAADAPDSLLDAERHARYVLAR